MKRWASANRTIKPTHFGPFCVLVAPGPLVQDTFSTTSDPKDFQCITSNVCANGFYVQGRCRRGFWCNVPSGPHITGRYVQFADICKKFLFSCSMTFTKCNERGIILLSRLVRS